VPQGNARRRIVLDDRDRKAYVNRFEEIAREFGWIVHSSCLMDTHHHAVVETPEPDLGIGMKRLQGGHARWFNARHGSEGHVFRQRFWSRRLFDAGSLLNACLYTVMNPVAAGLCGHPAEWPWCSYSAIAHGDPNGYLPGEERLLGMFGDTPSEARRRYAEVIAQAAEVIRAQRAANGTQFSESIARVAATVQRPGV
jgi:REP element-mobilizing transposase RayT